MWVHVRYTHINYLKKKKKNLGNKFKYILKQRNLFIVLHISGILFHSSFRTKYSNPHTHTHTQAQISGVPVPKNKISIEGIHFKTDGLPEESQRRYDTIAIQTKKMKNDSIPTHFIIRKDLSRGQLMVKSKCVSVCLVSVFGICGQSQLAFKRQEHFMQIPCPLDVLPNVPFQFCSQYFSFFFLYFINIVCF